MSPRPYRLGARSAMSAETRARIVAAAQALIADDGFHGVSVNAVAQRADVARATVYQQFGSKLGLLEAVVVDFEHRAGLAELVEVVEGAPPAGLVRSVVTAGCRYWATDPLLTRRILAVAATDSGAAYMLEPHDANRLRLLTIVVDRLVEAEQLRTALTPKEALDALWTLTSFWAFDELSRGRALSTSATADILAGLGERFLRGESHQP